MKNYYVSDIHLECFIRDTHRLDKALSNFDVLTKDDILILAGDICYPLLQGDYILDYLCDKAGRVLYTLGNHECYGTSVKNVSLVLAQYENRVDNFHFLDNSAVSIKGVDYTGGCGWSNVRNMNVAGLNDFRVINNMTQESMSDLYDDFKNRLNLFYNPDNPTVIVSHFLPSNALIQDRFKGDSLNNYFCNGIYDNSMVLNPDFWVYGHDHAGAVKKKINNTTFLTNQGDYNKVDFQLMYFEI